jgi:hypothetical protein
LICGEQRILSLLAAQAQAQPSNNAPPGLWLRSD